MTTSTNVVGDASPAGTTVSLEALWRAVGFTPNAAQEKAIRHSGGPLYLPAGPGSGKTKVILWRTVDLIVFRGIAPEEVFLSTFTEKAAFQLREGLRALLGVASNCTNRPYDISRMYVGTVHSLCQRLIIDRRFYTDRQPTSVPSLLDELAQYFHISNPRRWEQLVASSGLGQNANRIINQFLADYPSESRHQAACSCIALFNRLSEECLDCSAALGTANDQTLKALIQMCEAYRRTLHENTQSPLVDFSLLQRRALETMCRLPAGGSVFKHVIVDEYQDTNTIQERLFFQMASGLKNITVVGDDDQALYRFRGATVENFVEFPDRCESQLGVRPEKIPLSINYRSRKQIVSFYTSFMGRCNWKALNSNKYYRVIDKNITAHSQDAMPSVIATAATAPEKACREVAELVTRLIREKKVEDPNQIAFLFPSFKFRGPLNMQVQTLDDLHQLLISRRADKSDTASNRWCRSNSSAAHLNLSLPAALYQI